MKFPNAGFYFQDQHVYQLKIVAKNPVDIVSYQGVASYY